MRDGVSDSPYGGGHGQVSIAIQELVETSAYDFAVLVYVTLGTPESSIEWNYKVILQL